MSKVTQLSWQQVPDPITHASCEDPRAQPHIFYIGSAQALQGTARDKTVTRRWEVDFLSSGFTGATPIPRPVELNLSLKRVPGVTDPSPGLHWPQLPTRHVGEGSISIHPSAWGLRSSPGPISYVVHHLSNHTEPREKIPGTEALEA